MARSKVRRGKRFAIPADLAYRTAIIRVIARAEATARVVILERYPAWVAEVQNHIRNDAPTPSLGATIEGILLRIKPLKNVASDAAREQATRVNVKNQAQNNENAKRLIGVEPFKSEPIFGQILADFADTNASQIAGIADTAVTQLGGIIKDSLISGDSTKSIAVAIADRFGVARSRAEFIARDQTATLNSQLSQVRMRSAGVDKYEWSTSHDERVRPEHAARDGKIFAWADPPEGGAPGEDFNCRCVAIAIFSEE